MNDIIMEKGWDEKEQDGLREVEKILGRADEILEVRAASPLTSETLPHQVPGTSVSSSVM